MSKFFDINKQKLTICSRWDFYSMVIFVIIWLFQMASWSRLPLFMDCYYHLSVMRGFSDAGGWVGKAFWEYAPFGRPHLYPPLFHILELLIFKLGVDPVTIARLFDLAIYPLLIFVIWYVVRYLYSQQLGFFSLFLLCSSYSLYFAILNNTPFSLAFIFGLLAFYFFKKGRFLSSVLMLVLAFYTHALMSWLAVLAFVLTSVFDARERRACLRICLLSFVMAAPLWAHQLRFFSFIQSIRLNEFYFAEINLFLYLLAGIGAVFALKRRGSYLFFIALMLSMAFLLLTNRDRFLSGHGLIPLSLLGALILDELWGWLLRQKGRQYLCPLFFMVFILIFYLFAPLILISPFKKNLSLVLTCRLTPPVDTGGGWDTSKGETFYRPRLIKEVVTLVEQNSKKEDILYSNYNYAGGMIAVLAHRATSMAMLTEVKPFKRVDEIASARLILWFKDPEIEVQDRLRRVIERYGLYKIGETELVYLYLNEDSHFDKRVILSHIPFGVCMIILCFVLASVSLELFGKIKVDITR